MNRFLFSGLAASLTLSCTANGAVQTEEISSPLADESAKSENAEVYYASQEEADAALEAFDKANPSCQLWTNWQKMCSRTGPNGETWCATDPDRPVRPSTPFCAVHQPSKMSDASLSKQLERLRLEPKNVRNSRNRFCREYHPKNAKSENYHTATDKPAPSLDSCLTFRINRPFNGLNPKLASHPYCEKWETYPNKLFFCSKPLPHPHCSNLSVGLIRPKVVRGYRVMSNIVPESKPIWGLYCKNGIDQ